MTTLVPALLMGVQVSCQPYMLHASKVSEMPLPAILSAFTHDSFFYEMSSVSTKREGFPRKTTRMCTLDWAHLRTRLTGRVEGFVAASCLSLSPGLFLPQGETTIRQFAGTQDFI
jgi:hypothetical protein